MIEKPLEGRAVQSAEAESDETISRRRLLKVLAGTGGAVTAWSLLPGKWTRPVVEASMLPKNLQASPARSTLRLDNLNVQPNFGASANDNLRFRATFNYADDLSQVNDSATLAAAIDPCGQIFFAQSLSSLATSIGLVRNGTASVGQIAFPFNATFECINGGASLCVTLKATGRSVTTCAGIPNPQ